MRVLVTGGSGFVGAWIIKRLLDSGRQVRVLDVSTDRRVVDLIVGSRSTRLDWISGDVSVTDDVDRAASDCDAIVHLAGVLTPACKADPVRGARINVIGTLNVFAAAQKRGISRIVYTSSGAVYGPDSVSVLAPTSHYGVFKLANEGSATAFWLDAGIRSVGLRPFVIYGPGREVGLSAGVTLACRAAARGESSTIGFTGTAGFVFIEDVAAAYEAALDADLPGAHVFDLPGDVCSVDTVIAQIQRVVPGVRITATGTPLPSATPNFSPDQTEPLGPLPHTSLIEGIERTIAFYRAGH